MKREFVLVVALSTFLSVWSISMHVARLHASEPDGFKTVTLQVDGMT